jgi:hypothetical protein
MNPLEYKKKIEHELIKGFLDKFYHKVGYYPTVITNTNIETKDGLAILNLSDLEKHFEPYLPTIYERKMSLSSKDRNRSLVDLRFIFFFIARTMMYNLKDIGMYCGGRDHTTVIYGLKTFNNLYKTDENFRNRYKTIINNIKKSYESQTLEHTDKVELES